VEKRLNIASVMMKRQQCVCSVVMRLQIVFAGLLLFVKTVVNIHVNAIWYAKAVEKSHAYVT
jgi:hypothetical protein